MEKENKTITLSSGTGYPKGYIGYIGMPMKEWNHILNLEKWFYGGLVEWIIVKIKCHI